MIILSLDELKVIKLIKISTNQKKKKKKKEILKKENKKHQKRS